MPGGDNIGSRQLDMHLRGLEAMGAELDVVHGFIEARCSRLAGARIVLEFPSVGATENLLTAAVLAKGRPSSRTRRASRRSPTSPRSSTAWARTCSARARRRSRSRASRRSCRSTPRSWATASRPARCLMACGIAGGEITHRGRAARAPRDGRGEARRDGAARCRPRPTGSGPGPTSGCTAVDVATLPFPGFATDFMPLAVALLATADGTAIVTENVFDNRFAFVDELDRMGADVRHEGRHAVVRGVRAPLGRAGAGARRAGRRRAGARRPRGRGRDRGARPPPRRPRLPRPRRHAPRPRRRRRTRDRPVARSRDVAADLREDLRYWRRWTVCTDPVEGLRCRSTPISNPPSSSSASSRRSSSSAPRSRATAATSCSSELDDDGVVHVSLVGACGTCPISMLTLKAGVERIIMDRVPGVTEVVDDSIEE